MYKHSVFHKKELLHKVQSGELVEGIPVVPTSVSSFKYTNSNSDHDEVVEINSTVYARKIPLRSIRKKLLEKHEKLGLIRSSEQPPDPSTSPTRYLKIWHDHSSIAGHGHFLVLVSVIYDTAFYLTQEEVKDRNIDVQSTIETPEIHILGRSSSSISDQSSFSDIRNQCICELDTPLCLNNGMKVMDTLRFFHGDGPAQQFEAGNSISGNYCCVGCGVKSSRIDDIAYAFRCPLLSLKYRQEFLLQGIAWKNINVRPLDKLLLTDLKKELSLRDLPVAGKKKPALEKDYDDIRLGINNFPALLQGNPEATLESLNIHHYEVSPTEPLHDLKGHLGNIVDETLNIATGEILQEIKKVKAAVLTKEAIRCSDLRKAIILIYLKLNVMQPDSMLTNLYRTAVEITSLCYAHEDRRTPKSILCLYNRTFLHAYQCSVLFSNPKSITRKRMFGRYFHSIIVHAASLFRIISLRSLNTEQHERKFQQAKAITKGTSNNHADQVIRNIIQRLQFEQGAEDVIAIQESQIKSLSGKIGPMKNTIIPQSVLQKFSEHYQAHLERISDYLLPGPGIWWKPTEGGIMFLDGSNEDEHHLTGPTVQHFRSMSSTDIEIYLQEQWEACCSTGVELPAWCVRYNGQDGSLESISMSDTGTAEITDDAGSPMVDNTSMSDSATTLPTTMANIPVMQISSTTTESAATTQSLKKATSNSLHFKTTLAKNLHDILQNSCDHELREFDNLRFYIKNNDSRANVQQYIKLNKLFEGKILQYYNSTSQRHSRSTCKKLLIHEWQHKL